MIRKLATCALLTGLLLGATGCVLHVHGIDEKNPKKPEQRFVFLFGIPVFASFDAMPRECCAEHSGAACEHEK